MKTVLKIEGMSCSACSSGLEKYLNKQNGITNASVNLVMSRALIEFDDSLTIDDLNRFVEEAGFKSLGEYDEKTEKKNDKNKKSIILFTILIVIFMYIAMSHMLKLAVIPFLHMIKHPVNYGLSLCILTIIFIIYGFDIIRSGVKNAIHKTPNMDTLVTLGIIASFSYSLVNLILIILGHHEYVENLYFESVVMIIYFIKLGRLLDNNSFEKTKEAIKELVQITPDFALLYKEDGEKRLTIDEVKEGDILIAKPGMKIAVDGEIIEGESHFDESFLTGESKPSKKKIGDKVLAGTINIDGVVLYKAKKIGKDSAISEIVHLVIEATNTKAKIERITDKVSSYFVPSILLIALLTLIYHLIAGHSLNISITSFVTVLVVACPCALGLATPLAIIVSLGRSAKSGILIKNSEILEEAYKIDTIVFDKTGTLTYGTLKISEMFNESSYSDDEIINIMASLEKNSTHPISTAFQSNNLKKVEKFSNISGIGISGIINQKKYYVGNNKLLTKLNIEAKYKYSYQEYAERLLEGGNSLIYLLEDKKVIAIIGVKDIVRDNAHEVIDYLKAMNKKIIMLSGDNEKVAKLIAKTVGIKKVIANVIPQEKEKIITDLIKNNHKVMMVGDGINDAPSLARASIGVSIHSGCDIAADSSDIILMNDDLSKIPMLLKISQKTTRIIKENLFWAFIYNIFMIPIAIGIIKPFGLTLSPMFASITMTISSLTVVLNSLRLRK